MPPKTIQFDQVPQTMPFSAPTTPQRPISQNIWADLAKGFVKKAGTTVKEVGDMAASQIPKIIAGPLASSVPAITRKIDSVVQPVKDTIQRSAGLTDENLAPTNDVQRVGGYIETGAELLTGAGALKRVKSAADFTKGIIDAVSPKLSPSVTERALVEGKGKVSKLSGDVSIDFANDPHVKRLSDAITTHVPQFDPTKPLVHNINATRDAVFSLADDLKAQVQETGKDVIFPFKQLATQLRSIERPTTLTRDLEPVYDRVQAKLLQIVQQNGGKISDLFEARKEFDSFVRKALPNLYDKEFTPMRLAVTDMRRSVNDFIAEHLPKDIGFHDSLTTQSRLFEAIDNMAEKAASGAQKEVGTNALGRLAKKHPKISTALKYGLTAVGGGAAVKLLGD
jgi:hypothetical protein